MNHSIMKTEDLITSDVGCSWLIVWKSTEESLFRKFPIWFWMLSSSSLFSFSTFECSLSLYSTWRKLWISFMTSGRKWWFQVELQMFFLLKIKHTFLWLSQHETRRPSINQLILKSTELLIFMKFRFFLMKFLFFRLNISVLKSSLIITKC